MEEVAIVIPFYNGDEYIDACLKSLSRGSCAGAKKIVVNNSDKVTQVKKIAACYENVTVIDTKPRIGFGRACNEGAKIASLKGAEYIIVLNQDCIAHEDLVSELIGPFETSDRLAVTAPIAYEYDFSLVEQNFIRWYLVQCPELFDDALNHQVKIQYKLDLISGACFAIRSNFIARFGLFDPIYFMYKEDEDLCRRVTHAGHYISIVPRAKVAHRHSQVNASRKDLRKIQMWKRYSNSVYELKNPDKSLLEACLRIGYINIVDSIRYCLSLKIADLLCSLISGIRLATNLYSIIHSRNMENALLREHGQKGESGSKN